MKRGHVRGHTAPSMSVAHMHVPSTFSNSAVCKTFDIIPLVSATHNFCRLNPFQNYDEQSHHF